MKKSAIATAVALACAGAFATTEAQAADVQTSIYGIVDVGYASTSNGNLPAVPGSGGKSASGLITGGIAPSLIGVKAGRDLGDGLKAELQVEAGFQLHNGNHDFPPSAVSGNTEGFFNRIAALSLSGEKWGRASAGLQISPFVGALMSVDPMGLSQSGSALSFHLYNIAPGGYDNLFQRSLVSYATPNLSGFNATLSHGFNDSGSDGAAPTSGPLANKRSADIVTAGYAAGGLNVAAAYYQSKDAAGNTLGKDTMVGAGYKFGQFGVKALYASYDTGNGADKNALVGVGGDTNVTPKVNVALAYYTQKGSGTANDGDKTNMTVLKATYGLDRGSFLYATVSSTKNTKGAMVGPFMGSSSGYGSFTPAGESATGYSAGVFFAF